MGASGKGGSGDVEVIFNRTSRQLRRAAKACRVKKGGIACAVIDLAAVAVDHAQVLSAFVGDADGQGEDGDEVVHGTEQTVTPGNAGTAAESAAAAPNPAEVQVAESRRGEG